MCHKNELCLNSGKRKPTSGQVGRVRGVQVGLSKLETDSLGCALDTNSGPDSGLYPVGEVAYNFVTEKIQERIVKI